VRINVAATLEQIIRKCHSDDSNDCCWLAADPDDPEYLRQLRRPAEVKQDVRHMEDRQRVQLVLSSKAFRSELERLVDERIKSGEPCLPSLIALQQQMSGLNLPQSRLKHGALVSQGNCNELLQAVSLMLCTAIAI